MKISAFALVVICFLASCRTPRAANVSNERTLDEWNKFVEQNLPIGTAKGDVERFLDSHNVEHSFVADSQFPAERNTIVAFVRNNNDGGIVRKAGVQMKFTLDNNQRLISYTSREIFTGP
ncbi:MAG: hypothetical protein WAQ52_16515 [Terriglobales bacterium]